MKPLPLTEDERATYEWQLWVPDFGEGGQEKLKGASVLISRVGGLGSVVAYELTAAGIGTLVLAHGGNVKRSDLNRQLLMTHDWLGRPRIECAERRLRELNPHLDVVTEASNINEENVERLVQQADIIVDCAPLFEERGLMNREAVRQGKPLVECAMYELEAVLTSISPGKTPCQACLYPESPANWKRQFPVFGAVSGTVGCLAAMEAIKILTGIGKPLYSRLFSCDLRDMSFSVRNVIRNPLCKICGTLKPT